MRDIKFRGKSSISNEFIYGDLVTDCNGNCEVQKVYIHSRISGVPKYNGACLGSVVVLVEVIPETVGQYTGLEDSTGKDIYEGDIAQVYSGKDSMFSEKANVIFYANGWCVDASPYYPRCRTGWCVEIHSEMSIEIIGNIHEDKS